VRYLFEAVAFSTLLFAARLLPRGALRAMGSTLGLLGYLLDGRHRRIALENLRQAYGEELTPAEARGVARACWRHYGRITIESLAFPRMSKADLGRSVLCEGMENIREVMGRRKGALVFTGHFGHWELAGLMTGYLGIPLSVVARPLDNPLLERMLARLRGHSGNRVIHKRNAVREILKSLRQNRAVAIVIDQDVLSGGVFVPFFGRLASTTPALATLALRTGAPLMPVYCVPETGGRYRIVYGAPITVTDSGDREADVLRITAECTAILEGWVRQRPELWLWMHRRWKTRPTAQQTATTKATR
jgi:KDO2-lipid IV(A) lauroyltransferase